MATQREPVKKRGGIVETQFTEVMWGLALIAR